MGQIAYELINRRVELPEIQSDFYERNQIYYCIEKAADGIQVSFFNPEFAFEKQQIINCDALKVFSYLKAAEKYPEAYQRFGQDGFLFIRTDNANVSLFAMHSFK